VTSGTGGIEVYCEEVSIPAARIAEFRDRKHNHPTESPDLLQLKKWASGFQKPVRGAQASVLLDHPGKNGWRISTLAHDPGRKGCHSPLKRLSGDKSAITCKPGFQF
jgi:hypothetical protein